MQTQTIPSFEQVLRMLPLMDTMKWVRLECFFSVLVFCYATFCFGLLLPYSCYPIYVLLLYCSTFSLYCYATSWFLSASFTDRSQQNTIYTGVFLNFFIRCPLAKSSFWLNKLQSGFFLCIIQSVTRNYGSLFRIVTRNYDPIFSQMARPYQFTPKIPPEATADSVSTSYSGVARVISLGGGQNSERFFPWNIVNPS